MAIPQGITAPLFSRLPDRLFAPLSAGNRQQYWSLLCNLHSRFFGPDAPLPPSNGYLMREITQAIEVGASYYDIWETEEGTPPDTLLSIRANGIINRFVDTGWLQVEMIGGERRVSMRPVVSQFLSLLINFAETGPIFVSGKITSIYASVQILASGHAEGDLLSEVAEQCRNLLEHVRNTGTNIRDLMDAIKDEATTAMYVERFFKDYVVSIFIGDYHEMRTQEHPLSRRPEIISAIEQLHASDEQRERLIGWYEAKMFGGDRQKAEARFERDIQRILDLRRIDEYLTRLDDEIRHANKRGMAVVDYRLRALRPIDHLVERAIDAILTGTTPELCNPFPRGSLLGEFGLAEPRKRVPRPQSAPLRKQIPSDEDVARAQLMLKVNDARTVNPIRLANYVLKHLGNADSVRSESLTVTSIEDARALQTLWSIGVGMSSGNRQLQYAALGMAKGFRVRLDDDGDSLHTCITGRPFTIERSLRKPPSQKGA